VEDLGTADRLVNLRTADVRVSAEVRRFEESDGLVIVVFLDEPVVGAISAAWPRAEDASFVSVDRDVVEICAFSDARPLA